jgi:hypothetical protein
MPASGSPNATLATPVHRLIAHPGTGDRHQSERLLAFSRNDCSASAGARTMAPAKPYKPVPVVLPRPASDASFEAFRKELGEIASRKDRGALASKVVDKGFFWIAEKGDKASKRKSGIDNLAAAIGLNSQDGAGWEILADAADEATLEGLPDKKGVMCSPAAPVFNHKAAEQTAKTTGTERGTGASRSKGRSTSMPPGKPALPSSKKSGRSLFASCRMDRSLARAMRLCLRRGPTSCGS